MKARVVAILIATIACATAFADDFDAYRRGYIAYQWGRYENTVTEMRKAIAINPKESGEKVHIRLVDWKPYVPHYFLGRALAKLGQCAEAVVELNESLRQGALPEDFARGARRGLAECPSAPSPPPAIVKSDPAPSPAVTESQPASTVADPLPVQAEPQQPAPLPTPTTATSLQSAAPAPSRGALDLVVGKARKVLQAAPRAASAPEVAALRDALRNAETRNLTEDRLLSVTREVSAATVAVERWLTAQKPAVLVPAVVVAAVRAYVEGDYKRTVELLDTAPLSDERSRAHGHLFRAAALHALFVFSAGRQKELEARAAAEVAQYVALRPASVIDPRVFSPRFIDFMSRRRQDSRQLATR